MTWTDRLSKECLFANKAREIFSKITATCYVEIINESHGKILHWTKQCIELNKAAVSFEVKVSALDLEKSIICFRCKEPDNEDIIAARFMLNIWENNNLTIFSDQKLVKKHFCQTAAWQAFSHLSTKEAWLDQLLKNNNKFIIKALESKNTPDLLDEIVSHCFTKAKELKKEIQGTTFKKEIIHDVLVQQYTVKILSVFLKEVEANKEVSLILNSTNSQLTQSTALLLIKLLQAGVLPKKAVKKTISFLAKGLYKNLEGVAERNDTEVKNKITSIKETIAVFKKAFADCPFEEFSKPTDDQVVFSIEAPSFNTADFYYEDTLTNFKTAVILNMHRFSIKTTPKGKIQAVCLPKNLFDFSLKVKEEFLVKKVPKEVLETCTGLWTPEDPDTAFALLKNAFIAAYSLYEK